MMNGFLKTTLHRAKHAKTDIPAMVNSSVLLVLAWITAFWVFQFFTIIPGFTLDVKMFIVNSQIDFNYINTAVSDKDLWASADNVNAVFFTPVIFSVVLILVAMLFLIKWNSDRLNMRRYLFWLILCTVVRICGNLIFGLLFDLWNWNIVTDFAGLSMTGIGKYACIAVAFVISYALFNFMSSKIKLLFNPFSANRIDNLLSNVVYPVGIACVFLIIWNLPYFPSNEVGCILLMAFLTVTALCLPFVRRYRGLLTETEMYDENGHINLPPVIVLACAFVGNIIMMRGFLLESSPYRSYFVENAVMAFIIVAVALTLFISVYVYNKRAKAAKRRWEREKREIDMMNSRNVISGDENWETKNRINLDKYSSSFNGNAQTQDDDEITPIDLSHNEQYGFKVYDLSKYNQRNFK